MIDQAMSFAPATVDLLPRLLSGVPERPRAALH